MCYTGGMNQTRTAPKTIKFKTDKNGKRFALRLMNPGLSSRWVRMNVDQAELEIATGAAIQAPAETMSTSGWLRG